jgi:conjugative transfer signal peptidase TraF
MFADRGSCPPNLARSRHCIFVTMLAGMIGVCFHSIDGKAWIAFNGSASAPVGFYWLRNGKPRIGDFVVARLPPPLESWLVDRNYLPLAMPVLKQVAAVTGDQFCRYGTLILVNGLVVATASNGDSMARPLPVWNGCLSVPGEAVVLLTHQASSFDSRYFGPILRDRILKIAIPIWTWTGVGGRHRPKSAAMPIGPEGQAHVRYWL